MAGDEGDRESDLGLGLIKENDMETKLKVGSRWQLYYGPNNINNETIEIRGIVDQQVVFVTKKGKYRILSLATYKLFDERGVLQPIG